MLANAFVPVFFKPSFVHTSSFFPANMPASQSSAPNQESIDDEFYCSVRRSPIHGTGVFARRKIPAGTRIIEYTGERIGDAEAVRRNEASGRTVSHTYFFSISTGKTIDGEAGGNLSRFINHSCEPNCEAREEDGRVFIYALEDISRGTELNYRYGLQYDARHTAAVKQLFACNCGSAGCTGTMLEPKSRRRRS